MGRSCKRILIVVASLTGGGAERVAVAWADALAERGHNVVVLTDLARGVTYRPSEKVKVVDVGLKRGGRVMAHIMLIFRLLRVIREGVDVVIDVGHQYGAEVLAVSKILGVKTIQTDHNACSRPAGMELSLRECYRKFLQSRWFDAFTVLTEADLRVVKMHCATNARSLCNPLVFRENEVCNVVREKVVLAVGRLDVWRAKGFDILINVWAKLAPKYSDWKLRIIGSGGPEAVDFLQKMAMECRNRVEFVPFTAQIGTEYGKAEIFVMPSRCEGWGLVAVEAMAHGCCTVVADWDGRQREYVEDGVNGVLCVPGSVESLADALSRVLDDEELRRRLQRNSALGLERFAPARVAEQLEGIIYDVCGDKVR